MGQQQPAFDGVKVFSATKARERDMLGEAITEWMKGHPHLEVVDKIVTQSSDNEFHCFTITLFYREVASGRSVGRVGVGAAAS